jgi:hypothetical protein
MAIRKPLADKTFTSETLQRFYMQANAVAGGGGENTSAIRLSALLPSLCRHHS